MSEKARHFVAWLIMFACGLALGVLIGATI